MKTIIAKMFVAGRCNHITFCGLAAVWMMFASLTHGQEVKQLTALREPFGSSLPHISQELLYFRFGVKCAMMYFEDMGSHSTQATRDGVDAIRSALGIPSSVTSMGDSEDDIDTNSKVLSAIDKVKMSETRLADLRGKRAASLYRIGNQFIIHCGLYDSASEETLKRMDEVLVEAMWDAQIPTELAKTYRKHLRERKLSQEDFVGKMTETLETFENYLTIPAESQGAAPTTVPK